MSSTETDPAGPVVDHDTGELIDPGDPRHPAHPAHPARQVAEHADRTGNLPAVPDDLAGDLLSGVIADREQTDDDIRRIIVEQILSASTVDEVLADLDAVGLKTLVGEPLQIDAVSWQRTGYEEGNPAYAIVRGRRLDSGEAFVATSGATRVIAQLLALQNLDGFPQRVRVKLADRLTARGFQPYSLVADRPAPSSE